MRGLVLTAEKGEGDGYCLGPKELWTIREVAELFGGEVVMLPEKLGDRKSVAIDLTKTERDLGWKAEIRLDDHIREFAQALV